MSEEADILITDEPKEAKILLVDDLDYNRAAMADMLSQNFGYQVCSPRTPRELEKAIAFEVFDSVVADFELSKWKLPGEIIDSEVRNGADVAKLYRALHKTSSGCVYSTQDNLPGVEYARIVKDEALDVVLLPKLGSLKLDEIREDLTPFFRKTNHSYKSNPLFQPASYKDEPLAAQMQIYKRIYGLHSKWINLNLKKVGDSSWGVICGRVAQEEFYGLSLNGNHEEFKVEKRRDYPTPNELAQMVQDVGAHPFVFWNTKPDFLRQQFEQAGPGLVNIPIYLRDFFGAAMAPVVAAAYEDVERRDEAVALCRHLNPTGQVDAVKRIYKKLVGNDASVDDLGRRCREAHLPRVLEIYEARVGGIKDRVAFVEIRDWGAHSARSLEQFDLWKLKKYGVSRENQRFDYMLYELPDGDVATNIEYTEPGL